MSNDSLPSLVEHEENEDGDSKDPEAAEHDEHDGGLTGDVQWVSDEHQPAQRRAVHGHCAPRG